MREHHNTLEVGTNATMAAGLALLAVAAIGGGGLVASLDGAQLGYYLGGESVATGTVGAMAGAFVGAAGGFLAGATMDSQMPALATGMAGGAVGMAVGASAGAL